VGSVLRDDALEPQPAGVLEDRVNVPDDVLVELDALVGDLTQEVLEPAPALLQGFDPKVDAAQLQQVESIEEDLVVVGLAVELLEVRRAVRVAADRLAVEDQGGRPQPPRPSGCAGTGPSSRNPDG
jgi:hypothetical protein